MPRTLPWALAAALTLIAAPALAQPSMSRPAATPQASAALSAAEHLREAADAARKAELNLGRRQLDVARLYLQACALHLDDAAMARPDPELRGRIAALRRVVERTTAALGDPVRAHRLSQALVVGFSDATATAAGPGGGGGMDAEPTEGTATTGSGAETAPVTGAEQGAGTEEGRAFDDIDQDRPNQRGRQ